MKSMGCAALFLLVAVTLARGVDRESDGGKQQRMSVRLELFVSDLDKSIDFYVKVLGFERLRGGGGYVPVRSGSVLIGLGRSGHLPKNHYFNPELQADRRGLGAEIVLEVNDIQKMYRQVKDRGWAVLSPLQKCSWDLTDFRIVDPDGYYLRITSREETSS